MAAAADILPCGDVDGVNSAAPEFSPSLVEAEGRTILFFSSARSGTQQILHERTRRERSLGAGRSESRRN